MMEIKHSSIMVEGKPVRGVIATCRCGVLTSAPINVVNNCKPEDQERIRDQEPPAELTRENRRIILAKLEEVYVDEKTGYSPGWTDAKLALDLGVPRAWVK